MIDAGGCEFVLALYDKLDLFMHPLILGHSSQDVMINPGLDYDGKLQWNMQALLAIETAALYNWGGISYNGEAV